MSKSSLQHNHCHICPLAKQKRLPFISNSHLSISPFNLIHLDIWCPFSVESIDGFKYFLTIVDGCTRVTWIYMLKNKSDVIIVFPIFVKYVLTQYQSVIKAIRSDNAPELAFTQLIKEHGIIYQFSCAYTPQQNSEYHCNIIQISETPNTAQAHPPSQIFHLNHLLFFIPYLHFLPMTNFSLSINPLFFLVH